MKTTSLFSILLGALALAGCDTIDNSRAGSVVRGTVVKITEPAVVLSYQAASDADLYVVDQALTQLKASAIGQPDAVNGLNQVEVRFTQGSSAWTARAAQELRLALPADAIKARRPEAVRAIDSFGRYAATRPDAAATRLFVAAPLLADRNWMAAQLRRAGVVGLIDEQQQSYTAIGWGAPGLVRDRPVTNDRKPS